MAVNVTYLKKLLIDSVEVPARTATLNRSGNVIDNSNFVTAGDGFTSRMTGLLDWGVDGIISDYPDRLRALLKSRGMALPTAYPPP